MKNSVASDMRRQEAIHEAGHAVIGYLMGVGIRDVQIGVEELKGDFGEEYFIGGLTTWTSFPVILNNRHFLMNHWKLMILYYAGYMAEEVITGAVVADEEMFVGSMGFADGHDGLDFKEAMTNFPGDLHDEVCASVARQARMMVRNRAIRRAIESVAGLLMEKGKIDSGDLSECIDSAMSRSIWLRKWPMHAEKYFRFDV